ncbi:MAG: DUF1289 domain-containing protein [Rhodobacteraceae bacterium]|nr:DUF1289 domain-containing protein [Paracoccaceae bacterium]
MSGDEVWARDEPESPCVRICLIHPEARLCTGCLRSVDEISRWPEMTAAERRAVMAELPGRRGQVTRRRGGRKARVPR